MKKILALIMALCLFTTVFTACSNSPASSDESGSTSESTSTDDSESEETTESEDTAAGDTLTIYTWEGMYPPEVLEGFETETGIKVNYVNFDTGETMLSKLQAADGGDYDLVIVDDYIIEMVIAEGLAQELDTSKITNIGNVNPLYQGAFFDPEDKYSVPYGAGVQTIVYNPALVDIEVTGYADLWDEAFVDNVGITSNYRVMNGMALKTMGESYNTEDIATIEAAGDKLLELAPNIRLIKDDNIQEDLVSGEIAAAVMYTSQVTMAKRADPTLEVVYPEEGIGFGIVGQFIPSNAPNSEAAHMFIDYLLRPEVAAQSFEEYGYYCTTLAAEEFISEEFKSFLTLPEEISLDNMEMIQNISAEANDAHNVAWTEFRNAAE